MILIIILKQVFWGYFPSGIIQSLNTVFTVPGILYFLILFLFVFLYLSYCKKGYSEFLKTF